MLSLSVVIIASILASVALFFLMRSTLPEQKKQNILLLMGILIFSSIAISNIKTRDFSFGSLFGSHPLRQKLQKTYLHELTAYPEKYELDSEIISDTLVKKNYGQIKNDKDYSEALVYISEKDEGASYFLYQLATQLRAKKYPALYVKFQSQTSSTKQFFRKTYLSSFAAFKQSLMFYEQNQIRPYIIIDNVQLVPFQVLDILDGFEPSHSPNLIFNTENIHSFIDQISSNPDFVRKFQFQKWIGPDAELLQSLSPTNSYAKKLKINFETINGMKQGLSEEQILLKGKNSQRNVAAYFGVSNYYERIKRLMQKGAITMGLLQQADIPIEVVEKLERLRLLTFVNGQARLD